MNAIIFGNGYWSNILIKYIHDEKINIIKIIDRNTSKEDIELFVCKADIAFVCTPVLTHYSIVKMLLMANIDVFCEKILTKKDFEAQELQEIAQQSNLILFTDYTYLYSPGINCLKDNLSLIGDLKCVNAHITQYGKFYKNANALETIGVHMLSVIHYITNNYNKINININKHDFINQNNVWIDANLDCFDIHLECSLLSNIKRRNIEFIGQNGILSYDMLSEDTVIFQDYSDKIDRKVFRFNEKDNLRFSVRKFLECVSKRKIDINKKITEIIALEIN